jgi:hypothetical protein
MNSIAILEATADISYHAGHVGFTTGDSRADVSLFVQWAEEFEESHLKTNWNESDYILLIDEFVPKKISHIKNSG